MLEDLGASIGMSREEICSAKLLPTAQIFWAVSEGLMLNCSLAQSRADQCTGYGTGALLERGWEPGESRANDLAGVALGGHSEARDQDPSGNVGEGDGE
jgi:hypothetical protein